MTSQLQKNVKHKLNLDFLFLYQEQIIKGGGGRKDKKKFKLQVTHFPFTGLCLFLWDR